MKYIYKLALLIILLNTNISASSQGILGGEIRWDCISVGQPHAGKFVFYLKVYQACYNDSTINPDLASQQIMESNSPSGDRIMHLLPNYPKDVSSVCNPDTNLQSTSCGSSYTISAFNGAYKEYIYCDTFAIMGTPPTAAWYFKWKGGKRNRSSNLNDSLSDGILIVSKMYSFYNYNVYPCFDNAPESAELPIIMTCNAYDLNTYSATNDRELDILNYEWTDVLDSSNNSVSFKNTYSYSDPLPNISDNPNNIPAVLDNYEGLLSIRTFTTGGYFANQLIKSYKCGQLVAEINRNMYFQFYDCDSNVSPKFNPPFNNGISITDSVIVGERLSFDLLFTDSMKLSNGMAQRVNVLAYSNMFGQYIPANGSNAPQYDTLIGCLNPPCASLNAAPIDSLPIYDSISVLTHFSWQINCDHISTNVSCGQTTNIYNFIFKYWDDYCPIPAYNWGKFTIVVFPKPRLDTPILDSLNVNNTNGNIKLHWTSITDSLNRFFSYHILSSSNKYGPYALIDTLVNINDSTYIDSTANGLLQSKYYYIFAKGYDYVNYPTSSFPSDTLHNSLVNINMDKGYNSDAFMLYESYPNPTNSISNIKYSIPKMAKVDFKLYDLSGKLVLTKSIKSNSGINIFSLDISNYEDGVYFYSVAYEGVILKSKIIILH